MPWKLSLTNGKGAEAENSALLFLQQQGLTLLQRNFACKTGEVDLIMLDHSTLVFVEVRYRGPSQCGNAASSIDRSKQHKIRKTAAVYLQKYRQHSHRICRFDAISIDNQDATGQNSLQWMKSAF
ncbi:YraN family protein [Endozoicomonas sp. SCSIO W0465]|uniref:YraN family protein n=1 Tax=Endozoicomonas sp. SCSIO W0465 TaxID=2918516 RepID=UPI0020756672|nr:YraN family protein [Endozoicomonas sp. SCSIO W0465]USE34891.1 YraN family protein [Endozoicomonas sp. SCSIO W0465]